MQIRQFALSSLLASMLLAAPATAQSDETPTLTVNPNPLVAGSNAKITYSNPSLAGQTVTIDVSDNTRGGTPTGIEITLDANGVGTVSWLVPNWFGAAFNAPGCAELFVPIE